MSAWRRRLRRLRRYLVFGAASLLILWAVVVAIANQLLPLAAQHPERIAAWLSERAGRPIHFSTSSAYWTRSGPVFVLRELRVGEGEDSLSVGDAELLLRVYSGLVPGNPLTELSVKGLRLELVRDAARRWRVTGLGQGGGGDLSQIEALGELLLHDANVRLVDEAESRELELQGIGMRVRSGGGRLRIGATVPFGQGAALRIAAEVEPEQGDASVYIGGQGLQLDDEYSSFGWQGVALNRAAGDLHVWLEMQAGEVTQLQAEVELREVGLRGLEPLPMEGMEIEPRLGLDSLGMSARWQTDAQGAWHAEVPRLRIEDSGVVADYDGISLRHASDGLRLSAQRLPLQLLTDLLGLANHLSPPQRGRIYAARPGAVASEVAVFRPTEGGLQGRARLDSISWRGARNLPGLSGMAGQLRGDETGWVLDLDTKATVEMDWPGGLRQREPMRLSGSLVGYPDGGSWRIDAAPLRVDGNALGVDLMGGVRLSAEAGPEFDFAARLDPMPIEAAKRLLPVGKMPDRTVEWLDESLIEGQLSLAQVALVGAASDWPFADAQGRFQALARGEDVLMEYHQDWPRAESLSAEVLFQDEALVVQWARAEVMGLLAQVRAGGIDNFKQAALSLDIATEGSGKQLLELLRASPLQRRYGAQMAGLSVGGTGAVAVQLFLPLSPSRGEARVNGSIDLRGADLREARWRLAFDQASGRLRFNESGFAADGLSVRVDGEVAHLDVAVGSYTADAEQAVTASLRGRIPSEALLGRVDGLDWLKTRLAGSSEWQIELAVPREPDLPFALLLRSSLVGVAVDLPQPLGKAAETPLELELALKLPLDAGSIDLRAGQRMHLLGRWPEGAPFQGNILLGAGSASPPVDDGLHISGRSEALEVLPWVGLGMGGEGGGAFSLADIDVQAQQLDLLGRRFDDTRVQLDRGDQDQWRVRVSGEALQGELAVPKGFGPEYPLVARFERLHWPEAEGETPPLAAVVPSSLPPIDLRIDDLRYGEATLGKAVLETYPTLEGMHIQRFETRSDDLQLDAQGDWNLIGGRERSSFGIRFGGDDLGRMLGALGYDVPVDRGKTEASIDATWPGAPGAFELERLDGTLRLNIADGRFVDLDPGAGRILGLFSATEITRRLALDFRDFFESGLAFKTVSGSFTLDGGNAFTEDLDINSPSANISIRGRTGLKAKDYDQTVEVLPRAGGVLTVVGALAGGPAGAALGAVAQSVLQRPLGQMSRTLYHLTGSWAEPKTEIMERGPARRVERESRESEAERQP